MLVTQDIPGSESSSDPSKIHVGPNPQLPKFGSFGQAAQYWLGFGLTPIPIVPGTKRTAVKWDEWLQDLSPEKLADYWAKHPDHEVGCIVGDNVVVFDADGPESEKVLWALEREHGVPPKLTNKTARGCHHFFQLAPGTFVKSDSHSSVEFPHRLDVKSGRGLVILPPSTGKEIHLHQARCVGDLMEVDQDFIDSVFRHNGRLPPRLFVPEAAPPQPVDGASLGELSGLLASFSPDGGYDDWIRVLMAVFYETSGSAEGLALADRWSSLGKKYKGTTELEAKWRSFRREVSDPVTLGTLIKMARDAGGDVEAILGKHEGEFEVCNFEVISPSAVAISAATQAHHPLGKYSLRGRVAELEKMVVEQVAFLGALVLLGQATVIYALANTGKTLIVLHLIIEAIRAGLIDPGKLIYVNMDDNSSGLVEKVRLAEEYGFHMVADGHQGFEAKAFRAAMVEMIETDSVCGTIVILDTLKKFVNTMDKGKSSEFARVVRQFVLKGGTVVALSHANKNPGHDGRTVYSGTTDIVDDFDCAFTLSTVSQEPDTNEKIVEFTNIKRRGNVALTAGYGYALERDVSYGELLLSVREVDPNQLVPLKQAVEALSDAEVILAIEACIGAGIDSKMRLAEAAAERSKVSKRAALRVIEKYTGNDAATHRWSFAVKERGAKVYALLGRPSGASPC